jgi:hypothetical protein
LLSAFFFLGEEAGLWSTGHGYGGVFIYPGFLMAFYRSIFFYFSCWFSCKLLYMFPFLTSFLNIGGGCFLQLAILFLCFLGDYTLVFSGSIKLVRGGAGLYGVFSASHVFFYKGHNYW